MNTDRDYADMVNPYVRAEEEALRRGFWQGVVTSVWVLMWVCVIGMLAYAARVG